MRHTVPMILAAMLTIAAAAQTLPTRNSQAVASDAFGRLPFAFEPNRGQTDERVKFLARGGGYTLFLTPDEAVLKLRRGEQMSALRMKLLGADATAQIVGTDALPGTSNYFTGKDPAKWHSAVPHFGRVQYRQAYPGVDITFYGNQGRLEYDFVVKPGADAKAIRLRVDGAKSLALDSSGDLVMRMDDGEVRLQRPVIYQENRRTRQPVSGRFVVSKNNQVGFELGDYDRRRDVIIDPVLSYSTYLGGTSNASLNDNAFGIAVDSGQHAYVVGETASADFPTTSGALDRTKGGDEDGYVTKFSTSGSALIYSTFLGGNGIDVATAIAVDKFGDAYIAGGTNSTDFPTVNAFQSKLGQFGSAFISKLNASGTALIYSTYFASKTEALAIAVDSSGEATIGGETTGTDLPLKNAFQSTNGEGADQVTGFVSKLNSSGNALVFSTYLGGHPQGQFEPGEDQTMAVAVDSSNNVYATGNAAPGFPVTPGAYSTSDALGAITSGFLTKFTRTGGVVFSTYVPFTFPITAIAVDSTQHAYITGSAFGKFRVTSGAFQTTCGRIAPAPNTCKDAFVIKFNTTGTNVIYSTFLGGSHVDTGQGIALDSSGNAYVTGLTNSFDFPVTSNAVQKTLGGGSCTFTDGQPSPGPCNDAFITTLNSTGTGIVYYSTLLGGNNNDAAHAIAIDSRRNVYVTGDTSSLNFPVTASAFQKTRKGFVDAFVTKLSIVANLGVSQTAAPNPVTHGSNVTFKLTASNAGPDRADKLTLTDTIPAGSTFVSLSKSAGSCTTPAVGGTGTVNCTLTSLQKGSTWTVSLVVKATAAAGSTLHNTAKVASATQDFGSANNTSAINVSVK